MKLKEKISLKRRRLILFRHIAPALLVVLLAVVLFVPSMTCFVASTKAYETNSVASLSGNSWETVRRYLFSAEVTEKNNLADIFAKDVFAALIVFYALFIIGALAALVTSAAAVRGLFFPSPEAKKNDAPTRIRSIFLTFVPNRGVLAVLYALMLPVMFFPLYLARAYSRLGDTLSVSYKFLSPHIVAIALYVLLMFFIFAVKRIEKAEKLDIFSKK